MYLRAGTKFIFTFFFNSLKMLFLFSELIGDYLKVKGSKEVGITKFVIIKNRTYCRFMIQRCTVRNMYSLTLYF